ncbi:Sugar phosphate isomerase/epimerase [Thermomonospora echinospora]|uniref:Sugar phosphate isomerase/epimerase n=1 Tax=Thermomonospora echinospora TaxID=1992 RepID=A0A1H6DRX4_9ACTN|nr:sugar phosphate isomerase/epimerase [Thermomonospora echinospora]SEG87988.1 Sugar phosphate isomerase/epimerase [Thermomonospora echinospora]
MKLGLLTAALGRMSLEQVAAWTCQAGYEALEVAAWPVGSEHIHQAAHLDVAGFTAGDADRVRDLMDRYGLTISAVTYCGNNLHGDPAERDRIHRHLRACVDAAAALGVRHVTTFIGRDIDLPVADNLKQAERHLPPLARYAADRGVRLLAENCPMEGWHPDGYPANLAYSPELWDWMAGLGFGLTYDPSHLPWLGIDPLDALDHALQAGIVGHVQAKDIQIDERARTRYGVFGKTAGRASPTDVGWWRYRVPGRGQLDWNRIIDALYAAGYDGDIAVEHEDPVWGGTLDKTLQGMRIAASTLRPLIVAEPEGQSPPSTSLTEPPRPSP